MIIRVWTFTKILVTHPESRRISTTAKMSRTYSDAVAALNTLQTNSAVIDSIRKAGKSLNTQAIPEMIEWCRRAGYEPADFNRLNAIHVAGTKGKGSTSAFLSSILAQYLPSPSQPNPLFRKIGLYTSPHLRFVRERIQINNEPLPEPLFAKYFFEIWDRLENTARARGEEPTDKTAKPSYFRFLTLMAFHTYVREEVDVAIIECGIGGEYDSTNILLSPTVTGITSLGIDHVQLLGQTIGEIAWHKAGIMKVGVPAFTVPQPHAAEAVLYQRASEKSVTLSTVSEHPALKTITLGLQAPFQRKNASLGIELARTYLRSLPTPPPSLPSLSSLPEEFIRGLERVHWPGRCEIRREKGIAWHIDSGHTLESVTLAAEWFASASSSTTSPSQQPSLSQAPTILLFNQQTRDAPSLIRAIYSTLSSSLQNHQTQKHQQRKTKITHAVFCTNLTSKAGGYRPDLVSHNADLRKVEGLEVQNMLRDVWGELDGGVAEVVVRGSIEEAVRWVRDIARDWERVQEDGREDEKRGRDREEESGGEKEDITGDERRGAKEDVKVLVTGSVHLVGGFLEVLEGGNVDGGS